MEAGNVVRIIGRLRAWLGKVYVEPEITTKITAEGLLVHRAEQYLQRARMGVADMDKCADIMISLKKLVGL
ncbi:unnamed protein product, partial [marine sediment metagenome]